MAFNFDDPYQVHAYFLLGFWCGDCGTTLQLRTTADVASDAWSEESASQAKSAGWYVPPALPDGGMDVETCFCPACATKRALATSPGESAG